MMVLIALAAALWVGLLLVPWQPWRTRERLEPDPAVEQRFDDLTVLVPARNEAAVIGRCLRGLQAQGEGLRVIVIDDHSDDGTTAAARRLDWPAVEVIRPPPLAPGWSGKLWALEHGLQRVHTPLVLCLDADIELAPGMLAALRRHLRTRKLDLASLMAEPDCAGRWSRWLMPAFVYFFKLLYPFALANRTQAHTAAAAGGCLLVRRDALAAIGGFAALRDALIDDCTLARLIKRSGGRIWIGLTRGARSVRRYDGLAPIWNMVARTAFTQLGYSWVALAGCTAAMVLAFAVPLAALVAGPQPHTAAAGAVALAAMSASYVPALRYYGLPAWQSLTLAPVALLYLLMTWDSALRFGRGTRAQWRGRAYAREPRT